MGKRIISQARGKGSKTYRVRRIAFRYKVAYPREIKEAPYFMNKVTNFMDKENYFRLMLGGQIGGYLIDSKGVVTVGDSTIPHPKLKGFVIAKQREQMYNIA